jgi:hypothetical protein
MYICYECSHLIDATRLINNMHLILLIIFIVPISSAKLLVLNYSEISQFIVLITDETSCTYESITTLIYIILQKENAFEMQS